MGNGISSFIISAVKTSLGLTFGQLILSLQSPRVSVICFGK